MLVIVTWYHFIAMRDQKQLEFDCRKIPKRDTTLEAFSDKLKIQIQWKAKDIDDEGEGGTISKAIKEVLQTYNLNSKEFYTR